MPKRKRTALKKEERVKVWNKFGKRCAYCGEKLAYKDMQVDHIKAKARGGKDSIENYNPACRPCNFYKGAETMANFKKKMKTLQNRLRKVYIVKLAEKYGIIKIKPFTNFYFEKYEQRQK